MWMGFVIRSEEYSCTTIWPIVITSKDRYGVAYDSHVRKGPLYKGMHVVTTWGIERPEARSGHKRFAHAPEITNPAL